MVEAAHAKFDKFWQRYKVIDVESDKHGENLLECVIDFVTKKHLINWLAMHVPFPIFGWSRTCHCIISLALN